MATLAQMRAGLKTRLETISGLRAHAVWPDTVNAPTALVTLMRGPFKITSGLYQTDFEIMVLAAPTGPGLARAQVELDLYLDVSGTYSIRAAIDADTTLGGVVADTYVDEPRDPNSYTVGGVEYMGAKIPLRVLF